MITKLDIRKFGLFENYQWDAEIGRGETFRRLNVIYGRNYSGKTTLARVLKSIGDCKLTPKYEGSSFQVWLANSQVKNESNLEEVLNDYKIRVYNTDFVKENLSWLYNDDGTINPFTILGAKNVDLDKKIKELEDRLGSVEERKGLLYEQSQAKERSSKAEKAFNDKKKGLNDNLIEKAKGIKNNGTVYNYPTYQIRTIKEDIPHAKKQGELDAIQTTEQLNLLKEDVKPTINPLREINLNFIAYYDSVKIIVEKKIKPSQPIKDLINNHLLQEWVRQGVEHHKAKRNTCGFCGGKIENTLWEKLDEHFSKESELLRKEISEKISDLEKEKINLAQFFTLSKGQFYSNLHSAFDDLQKRWISVMNIYSGNIDKLAQILKEREQDIFSERNLAEIDDVSQTVFDLIIEYNKLIDIHNGKTKSLGDDKEKAREELRYSEVAKFLTSISYDKVIDEIDKLEKDFEQLKNNSENLEKTIEQQKRKKQELEAESKDESKGAELVNQYLSHFFGHNELKLIAEQQEEAKILFRIVRGDQYASNLSEGECSLISFCYFIARMEDELKDDLNNNKLIIYIDDPISSLDSNHIFFMFSLIESVIARPMKYCQLFISTHNLDFLKYLKQLSCPKYKPIPEAKKDKLDLKYFLIERCEKSKTRLKLAPTYLKEYITEFNYLFSQIFHCSKIDGVDIEHDYQYNFGNNMRKFLEAYLFYRYPTSRLSFDGRVKKFFHEDEVAYNLVRRVINEYSHLGERFDRGLEPVDIDEIRQISQAVMKKLEETDKEQFDSLVDSVEKTNSEFN